MALSAHAQGFKFSNPPEGAEAEAAKQAQREATVSAQLATPCRDRIRNRKIMVLIAEEKNGMMQAEQGGYSRHVDSINLRLEALGLKTYSAEEVRRQVAQEEIDAYFKNDPDRALSASRRMAAQYVLRGVIASKATRNAMVNVNTVNIDMQFTLTDSAGRPVSTAAASNASYSGSDTSAMALTLIEERADEVVARLYSDYCQDARGR
ncbi:hypothetical protein [Caenimonas sp. SL110]|uniref:hypothetical protein n=1 Tax=Caenimonas sp. SL110 TaxID=1450524 RepID=UPI00128AF72F|nr:hypothetical protein [Caenimonas sp. SL110]